MTFFQVYVTEPGSPETLVLNENVPKTNISVQTWTFLKADSDSRWLLKYAGSKKSSNFEKIKLPCVSGIET